ncbi:hypothetical protein UNDYM_5537 [Undibacterium sp. YM2]|uniref:hypothetical protein n=1 Tax=Undibacterium sp. YM2 TaxID=2058625 RepID=UPI001331CF76|nr:hypothetical protein [Undibacterium sp. YM2]BBB69790.1 hypothetical protein UNDYM_5537 [Undibacterium sp. YM2]
MAGLLNFSLSLLVLVFFAFGTMRKSRRLINLSFFAMVAASLLGWYQYIFPAGLSLLFYAGTLATVLAISVFFYAIYSYESVWTDLQEIKARQLP